eukprot:4728622-Pyramimonas_sp.AAC.1
MAVALLCILSSRAFRNLEPSWGSPGVLLGPSWGPPGALSWGSLEVLTRPSWSPLGAPLGCIGALLLLLLGGLEAFLGVFWDA